MGGGIPFQTPPNVKNHIPDNKTLEQQLERSKKEQIYKETLERVGKIQGKAFSDGSAKKDKGKKPSLSWAAIRFENGEISKNKGKVHPINSIQDAEFMGIYHNLREIEKKQGKWIVAADNIGALKQFTNPERRAENALASEIIDNIGHNANLEIHMVWSPGHIGIPENELADKEAKEAGNDTSLPEMFILNHQIFKQIIKRLKIKDWKEMYQSTKEEYRKRTWPLEYREDPIWQEPKNKIRRLLQWRCGIGSIGAKDIVTSIRKECPHCNGNPLQTVWHTFAECRLFRDDRLEIFGSQIETEAKFHNAFYNHNNWAKAKKFIAEVDKYFWQVEREEKERQQRELEQDDQRSQLSSSS
jgi:ribonuclease HI